MEPDTEFQRTLKTIRGLPLWLQAIGILVGVLAIPGTVYTSVSGYDALVRYVSPETIATSTVNVSDIFYRLNEIDRPIDQRTILTQYKGTKIVGKGSFSFLGGSKEDKSYWVHASLRTGIFARENIACMFRDRVDEATEKRLDLLKKGQGITFSGTFTNSSLFGSNAWVIDDCQLVEGI